MEKLDKKKFRVLKKHEIERIAGGFSRNCRFSPYATHDYYGRPDPGYICDWDW